MTALHEREGREQPSLEEIGEAIKAFDRYGAHDVSPAGALVSMVIPEGPYGELGHVLAERVAPEAR